MMVDCKIARGDRRRTGAEAPLRPFSSAHLDRPEKEALGVGLEDRSSLFSRRFCPCLSRTLLCRNREPRSLTAISCVSLPTMPDRTGATPPRPALDGRGAVLSCPTVGSTGRTDHAQVRD